MRLAIATGVERPITTVGTAGIGTGETGTSGIGTGEISKSGTGTAGTASLISIVTTVAASIATGIVDGAYVQTAWIRKTTILQSTTAATGA